MIRVDYRQTEKPEALSLSVILHEDAYYYALSDVENGRVYRLHGRSLDRDPDEQGLYSIVDSAILDNDLGLTGIQQVQVALDSRFFTLVPKPLFDPKKIRSYFDQICYLSPTDEVLRIDQPALDSVLLYPLRTRVIERIRAKWPQAHLYHYIHPLLEYAQSTVVEEQGDFIWTQVLDRSGMALVYKGGRLQIVYRYDIEHADDFIYHMGHLFRSFELDRQTVPLYYSGQLDKGGLMLKNLSRFIYTIMPVRNTSLSQLEAIPGPSHLYLDMDLLRACG